MDKTALLVVDVQTALVEDQPYNRKKVLSNIGQLISTCRAKQIEVIYVRHDGGAGSEFERNTRGWQIHGEIAPAPGEMIIDKCFNSAFRGTELKDYLNKKEIKSLILVGMQTEYCIDITCKVAFEFGYDIIIPEDTTTTFDNNLLTAKALNEYFMYEIWNNRYAKVHSFEEVLNLCNHHKAL